MTIPVSWGSLPEWQRTVAYKVNPVLAGYVYPQYPSAPADPSPGLFYYDTTLNLSRYWNGSAWVDGTGTSGTVVSVAASGGTTGLSFTGTPITASGTLTLAGTLNIANGGTGATSQAGARTNLGLVIGTDVQAYSAKLAAYAGGDTPSAFTLGIVDSVDAAAWRAAIGAGTSSTTGTVTSVQASGGTTGLSFSGGPITGSGTLTLGGTLGVANGGTGAATLTGYLKGNGSSAFTASATIPASDIASGAALTKTDDTNVTLTLGGSASSALLAAASLSLGWAGTLSVARGGTGTGTASGTALDNITAFASTGHLVRTGAGAYAFRTLAGPAAGITVTNGSGVSGNPTLALADDLAALEALSDTNTIYYRSGVSAWSAVTVGASLSFSGGTLDAVKTIDSGTYTPTLTNVTNVSASTAYQCRYLRIGNVVTVSGRLDVDPTAAGLLEVGISLPIASNFTTVQQCSGTAASEIVSGQSAAFYSDTTNDRARLMWTTVDTANRSMCFIFQYDVV